MDWAPTTAFMTSHRWIGVKSTGAVDKQATHLSIGFHVNGGNYFHKILVHHGGCEGEKQTFQTQTEMCTTVNIRVTTNVSL